MASFGFGRERRLRRRADFLRVQSNGERATSRHFVLLVCAREPADEAGRRGKGEHEDGHSSTERVPGEPMRAPSRLGVVATRKVGDATMRNRIKRLCRECFRLWPGFVPDGIDLVVIGRAGADQLTLDRVRDEWSRARPALLKRCESVLRGSSSGARPPSQGSTAARKS